MDIKLNLCYYASIMPDAFIDQNYAGIIGLGLITGYTDSNCVTKS